MKKLVSSPFVPKGQVDFQSFRMRSLRLRVTCHGNKDVCLSGFTTQCFNFQRLRPKASPIHSFFRFDPYLDFFTPPLYSRGDDLKAVEKGLSKVPPSKSKRLGSKSNGKPLSDRLENSPSSRRGRGERGKANRR